MRFGAIYSEEINVILRERFIEVENRLDRLHYVYVIFLRVAFVNASDLSASELLVGCLDDELFLLAKLRIDICLIQKSRFHQNHNLKLLNQGLRCVHVDREILTLLLTLKIEGLNLWKIWFQVANVRLLEYLLD